MVEAEQTTSVRRGKARRDVGSLLGCLLGRSIPARHEQLALACVSSLICPSWVGAGLVFVQTSWWFVVVSWWLRSKLLLVGRCVHKRKKLSESCEKLGIAQFACQSRATKTEENDDDKTFKTNQRSGPQRHGKFAHPQVLKKKNEGYSKQG